jgi:hypothetical protein
MIDTRLGALAALACAATLGVASAQATDSSGATLRLTPAAGIPHLAPVAPEATGTALGSPEAARLPALKIAKPLAGGLDVRTLDLKHWVEVHPPHSPANDPVAAADVRKAGSSLPLWSGQVKVGTKNYNFTMVGATPLGKNAGTTNVKLVIVPLRFVFNNGTLDATKPLTNCSPAGATTMIAQSPLFKNVPFKSGNITIGNSQFIDLFQRQNFWGYITKNNPKYHLLFTPSQVGVVQIAINANVQAMKCTTGANGGLGSVDFNGFDALIRSTLIPKLKQFINPSVIPIFVAYDVVFGGAAGYHDVYKTSQGEQVYGVTTYLDIGNSALNTEVGSHEFAEFTDDPLVTNPTPAWGHIGQDPNSCQANLEPGDPLTGENWVFVKMSNGFTYELTDLANFSWFYRESPSFAANGFYTMFNFFSSPQPICH